MRNLIYLSTMVSALTFASCTSYYYQVSSVSAVSLTEHKEALVQENDDCAIFYNLWSEGGDLGFNIFNKTDKELYIDLSKSFYIRNGVPYDYYKNRDFNFSETNTLMAGAQRTISVNTTHIGITAKSHVELISSQSSGVTYHEQPIICIPPKSHRKFHGYKILNSIIEIRDKTQDFPKEKSNNMEFNEKSSPVAFRNRISYSFDAQCTSTLSIESTFLISNIANYSEKFIKKERKKGSKIMMMSPSEFYNIYYKKP